MFVCDSSPIFENFYNLIMYFQGVNQDDLGHFWDAFLEKREVVPSRNLWGPWGEPCEMTLWVWGYLWSKLRPDACFDGATGGLIFTPESFHKNEKTSKHN